MSHKHQHARSIQQGLGWWATWEWDLNLKHIVLNLFSWEVELLFFDNALR